MPSHVDSFHMDVFLMSWFACGGQCSHSMAGRDGGAAGPGISARARLAQGRPLLGSWVTGAGGCPTGVSPRERPRLGPVTGPRPTLGATARSCWVSYLQPLQGGGRTAAWAPSCSPGPHRGLEVIQHALLFILLCTQPCEEDCL